MPFRVSLSINRMRIYRLFYLLIVTTMALAGPVRAGVIISEIMYNPDGMDSDVGYNKEWVEIYNNGVAAVDLSGWVFEDIQDMDAASPIPNGTLIGPGEAIVLTGDAVTFDAQWGSGINRIELSNFPNLQNGPSSTEETPTIKNSSGSIVDLVNYDDQNGWPMDKEDGFSIYLRPDSLNSRDNNIGNNWGDSVPGVNGAYFSTGPPFREKASPGIVATQQSVFPDFTPSADAAWSMVIFPDTQNYVKTPEHLSLFVDMAEWVRDNRDEFNIRLVLQEGDIVNKNNNENPVSGENPSTLQWQNAQTTMGILNGEVPYVMAAGNHDTGIENAEDDTTRLNEFFSASDNPLNDPAQGGILKGVMEAGHLENAYYEMTAPDGRELLIFSLAWDPQQQTLNWANQIAGQSKYNDHTAILLTHNYLKSDGNRGSEGQNTWDEFISENENFEMTFNGHVGGDGTAYLLSTGDDGNQVHQMVFNTQDEGNGGNGWIRLVEFLDDGVTVRVRTYSTTFCYIRDDSENAFTFELSPFTAFLPGDFNDDGIVDAGDYTVWRDNLGSNNVLPNDDGIGNRVGAAHYNLWVANFGNTYASNAQSIPEPGSIVLLWFAALAWMQRRSSRNGLTNNIFSCDERNS